MNKISVLAMLAIVFMACECEILAPTQLSLNGYVPKKSNRVNMLTQAISARLLKNNGGGSSVMSLQTQDSTGLLNEPFENIQKKLQSRESQGQQNDNENQFQPISRSNNQRFEPQPVQRNSFHSQPSQRSQFQPAQFQDHSQRQRSHNFAAPASDVITLETPTEEIIEPVMPQSHAAKTNNRNSFEQELAEFEEGPVIRNQQAQQFVQPKPIIQQQQPQQQQQLQFAQPQQPKFIQQQQQQTVAPSVDAAAQSFKESNEASLREQLMQQQQLTQKLMQHLTQLQEQQTKILEQQKSNQHLFHQAIQNRFQSNDQQQQQQQQPISSGRIDNGMQQQQQQQQNDAEVITAAPVINPDIITLAPPIQPPPMAPQRFRSRPVPSAQLAGPAQVREMFSTENTQETQFVPNRFAPQQRVQQQQQQQPEVINQDANDASANFQDLNGDMSQPINDQKQNQFQGQSQFGPSQIGNQPNPNTNLFNQQQFTQPQTPVLNQGGFNGVGCKSNPCQNGANCVEQQGSMNFFCQCKPGFIGNACQTSNVCDKMPCGSDGTCLALEPGHSLQFVCVCQQGAAVGKSCQSVEANPCLKAPPIVPNSRKQPTMFPLNMNKNVFVQCEGLKPNVRFCQFPLMFSFTKQMCDWSL
jgi:hypothetical protein